MSIKKTQKYIKNVLEKLSYTSKTTFLKKSAISPKNDPTKSAFKIKGITKANLDNNKRSYLQKEIELLLFSQ